MKILHIASENVAGVPGILVKAERKIGHYSRLMTYFKSPRSHWDDIVLNLPFSNTWSIRRLKKTAKIGTYGYLKKEGKPPVWEPKKIEKTFYLFRDILWDFRLNPLKEFIRSFDCYLLDGGLGLLRNGKIIESLKKMEKKIVILYLGSDLRARGILPHIEKLADAIFTTEFDHTFIHPQVQHIHFPFEVDKFKKKQILRNSKLTICHAPTKRHLKGTEYLLKAVDELKSKFDFEFLLIENKPHKEVLEIKEQKCDVLVDQLTDFGGFGYGMNSMECLSMGIPSITYINPQYDKFLKTHPFINANKDNIKEVLAKVLTNPKILLKKSSESRKWVVKEHNYINVSKFMLDKLLKSTK
jgi:glycosyltransferase involved in cell wall biosynthesis